MTINHFAIWVKDLEALKNFYIQYFEAAAGEKYVNAAKGFSSYFLSFADSDVKLELMHKDDITQKAVQNSLGFAHLAIGVGTPADVDAFVGRFIKDGHKIVGQPRWTGDGYYEAVIEDIEGNLLEIVADAD